MSQRADSRAPTANSGSSASANGALTTVVSDDADVEAEAALEVDPPAVESIDFKKEKLLVTKYLAY